MEDSRWQSQKMCWKYPSRIVSCCPIVHSTKGQHNLLLSQISILGLLQQAQSPTPELGGWGPEKRLCSDSSELGQDLQLHQPGWAQLASRHSLERAPCEVLVMDVLAIPSHISL